MTDSNAYGTPPANRLKLFAEIVRDPGTLTEEQADGRACLFCGRETGGLVPVGIINHVQVFAHEGDCGPRNVVLDAGPVLHPLDAGPVLHPRFSPATEERLAKIEEAEGIDRAELVRRALSWYVWTIHERELGTRFLVQRGHAVTELMFTEELPHVR